MKNYILCLKMLNAYLQVFILHIIKLTNFFEKIFVIHLFYFSTKTNKKGPKMC